MKRFGFMLAAAIIVTALTAGSLPTLAETSIRTGYESGIMSLMDASRVPASTSMDFDIASNALPDAETKVFSQNLISSNGDILNIRFSFMLNAPMTDAQWQTVKDWLKGVVISSVQNVQADPASLVNVVANAYTAGRAAAQPGETGMPAWASDDLLLNKVTAVVPYYPELNVGDNSQATQALQEKLIEYGFLNDTPDGKYGENTRSAVMLLENYVRLLEADHARRNGGDISLDQDADSGAALALSNSVGEDRTQQTSSFEAKTNVDGVADPLLQAYLFSSDFKVTRGVLSTGEKSPVVSRVQTRLNNLGYMSGAADGTYGDDTAYSVRLFQYYNGLETNGVADADTQALLFSDRAVKPDNSLMKVGSTGDAVKKLQRRLRVLGFGAITVDGSFGSSTETCVKRLQNYVREAGLLKGATANGIADPMLLDVFYAKSFPAIPEELKSGDSGIDVIRLQRRLTCLDYYFSEIDGSYGAGTAEAVKFFQKMHGLKQTGMANNKTLKALFNADAKKALLPYMIRVSTAKQRVYVLGLDSKGEYTKLVKTMICSTGRSGSPTPKGTYVSSTCPGARWHEFKKFNCWAQYAFYIEGDIMFHSVLYSSKNGYVTQSSVNNLGSRASHGCVRLSVADAKWIWTNCKAHTKVVIE